MWICLPRIFNKLPLHFNKLSIMALWADNGEYGPKSYNIKSPCYSQKSKVSGVVMKNTHGPNPEVLDGLQTTGMTVWTDACEIFCNYMHFTM